MLRSIDRYVAGGGTLIVLVDPFVRFNRASRRTWPAPSDELNDITDLLAAFGFRFDAREVVGDETFAAPVSIGGAGAGGYPFWIRVPEAGLAQSHPVTGALRELLFAEPGALEIEAGRGIVPLAFTSGRSGVLARERFADATPEALASEFAAGEETRVLAAYASGPFTECRHQRPGRGHRAGVRGRGRGLDLRSVLGRSRRCGGRDHHATHQRQSRVPDEHGRARQRRGPARPDSHARPAAASVHPRRATLPRRRGGHAGRACRDRPPDLGRRASHREARRRVRDHFTGAASRRGLGGGDRDPPKAPAPCVTESARSARGSAPESRHCRRR